MNTLRELCSDFQYELISGDPDTEVSDIVYNSKNLKPDTVFVCMEGARFDPHTLVPEAFQKGCRAFVVSKLTSDMEKLKESSTIILCKDTRSALSHMSRVFFGYPERRLRLIGITGTKGKTTAAFMIKAILEAAGHKTGMIGTVGCMIGDKLYPTVNTTPESYEIQAFLRRMADEGCSYAVMECSSQGFKLRRLSGVRFSAGVFLNISPDHIGPNEHESFEEYLYCKSRLAGASDMFFYNAFSEHIDELLELVLKDKAEKELRSFGVMGGGLGEALEGCDISSEALASGTAPDNSVKTSPSGTNELKPYYIASEAGYVSEEGFNGVGFRFSFEDKSYDIRLSMPGIFNVEDALCALSVCSYFGIDMKKADEALSHINVSGRTETVYDDGNISIMVDYAHNEVSMKNLILTLRNFSPKRIVTVFGCGGDRSKERRIGMGREAALMSDFTVMTSDNPRTEAPEAIIDDIEEAYLSAGGSKDAYVRICDRREAIEYAMRHAKKGDLIAVIGKGHEQYQEINGVRTHFSDQEEIRRIGEVLKDEAEGR